MNAFHAYPRRRRARDLALPALLALALGGCGPRLRYEVDARGAPAGDVQVMLRLSGAPRDSLVLRGYGTTATMRLSAVSVDAPGSAGFAVDSVAAEGGLVPRIVVMGPVPPVVAVRYHVAPAAREGDAHVGFTGNSFGYVSDHSMFATGRALFLLPAEIGRGMRIRVHFRLPQGWEVVAPWAGGDDGFLPGVRGQWAAEDLIAASLGLGAFDSRDLRVGRTTYRLAFERDIASDQRARAAAALERAIRFVHQRLGCDPGDRYTIVVMPETAERDALVGDGWASGQGGTLAPITASRLHTFALRLIDAGIASAPNRVVAHDAKERWVLAGLREVVAWRGVADAGLADQEQIERDLAADYASNFEAGNTESSLEESESDESIRTVAAPLALLSLERTLGSAARARGTSAGVAAGSAAASRAGGTKGTRALGPGSAPEPGRGETRAASPAGGEPGAASPVEAAFHAMLAHGMGRPLYAAGAGFPARSFWASIPARDQPAARAFRSRYVSGHEPLPAEEFFDLAATGASPTPPRGPAVERLVLAFTANTHGYLENCGCKANQAGGVSRRATALARLRAKGAPVLAIDAGGAFPVPGRSFGEDVLARGEQELYLATLMAMGYRAVAVGESELAQGLERFRSATRGVPLPWLAANVRRGEDRIALPWVSVHAGSSTVAVIGLFEPPRGRSVDPRYEREAAGLTIEDPLDALRYQLPSMRAHADLVAVVGRISPATIRRLVAAEPGIDVIVSSEDQLVTRSEVEGEASLEEGDGSGFIGATLVLYANLESFGIGSAVLGLDAQKRIASAEVAATWLGDSIPEDQAIRGSLTRFYRAVGASAAAQASVPPLFPHDSERMTGAYAGAAACSSCHAAETAQWKSTRHASAYKTLLDLHRHYQPRCVVCHVVGYGTRSGYRIGASDAALVNVQCEVCHGPGGEHAMKPARDNIRKAVPEAVCLECHTPDHSDHFVYAEKLPRVVHRAAVALAHPSAGR